MQRVTIKDDAKQANVSPATVSRIINKNEKVDPAIKEKVLEVIRQTNYFPNSIARSLKKDSTLIIGLLVSDISNPYFTTIAKGIENTVSRDKYNIIFCSTENNKDIEMSYLKLLMSRNIDALILNTTGYNDEYLCELSKNVPIVLVDRKVSNGSFKGDLVAVDDFQIGYTLTTKLISLGHRKIGVINGLLNVSTGGERFLGFKSAMKKIGIDITDSYPYIYNGDFTMESGYQGAAKLFNSKDRPTALVIMNNEMTYGALSYYRVNGVAIPDEISIVAYGYFKNMNLMYIKPSVAVLEPEIIGTKAAEMIMERIAHNSSDGINNRTVLYSPQFVDGNSTKPI